MLNNIPVLCFTAVIGDILYIIFVLLNQKQGGKMKAKILKWIETHEKTLRSLYADFKKETGDKTTSFSDFSVFMYSQCKH